MDKQKKRLTGAVGNTVSEFKAFILKGNIIDMAVGGHLSSCQTALDIESPVRY